MKTLKKQILEFTFYLPRIIIYIMILGK